MIKRVKYWYFFFLHYVYLVTLSNDEKGTESAARKKGQDTNSQIRLGLDMRVLGTLRYTLGTMF
jgi:hypothetical protein